MIEEHGKQKTYIHDEENMLDDTCVVNKDLKNLEIASSI